MSEEMKRGKNVNGKEIIIEKKKKIVIEDGWKERIKENENVVMKRIKEMKERKEIGKEEDKVMMEILNNILR